MKNNIAMRMAAILFIITMISTCAFSSTFAKYVTTGSSSDSARVAKWAFEGNNDILAMLPSLPTVSLKITTTIRQID